MEQQQQQQASSASNPQNSAADSALTIGLKIGSPAKKGRIAAAAHGGGAQPARCQVEGCNADLSDAKAYYSRHKVCGMHSKSPTVVVAGLHQRFCQQCSRFHQLPEFDQGKRSCRRRLAGHNERRRKPPPGSLLSTRFGSLGSPLLDGGGKGSGSFLMDFSSYSSPGGRDSWPNTRAWDNGSERFLLLQGSGSGGPTYPAPNNVPPGECFSGVTSSSRALSLLSNQPMGVGVNTLLNNDATHSVHPSGSQVSVAMSGFSNPQWGFKGTSSSSEMLPDLGLAKVSHSGDGHYSAELGIAQQSETGYDSSIQNMHWTL